MSLLKSYVLNRTPKNAPRWLVLLIDLFLVVQTFFIAHVIRFNFSLDFDMYSFFLHVPVLVFMALFSFLLIGSHKGVVRHTGIKDALNVFIGSSVLMISMFLFGMVTDFFSLNIFFEFSTPIIVIHYLLNTIVLITSRFVFKTVYYTLKNSFEKPSSVIIYGAGEMGAILNATLGKDANSYKVVAFIDDNSKKVGMKINRLPILEPKAITEKFVREHKIQEIIIAIRSIKPERILEIVDRFYKLDVKVKIAPLISRWINGDLNLRQIKQIQIEDLLERSPINLNNDALAEELKDKRILVTGASGSIGSEISRQLSAYPCQELLLLDQSESELYNLQQELKLQKKTCFKVQVADVRDRYSMEAMFETFKPDFVFHAAAYKHVPLMEENPYEAVKVNVGGTKNIADLSFKHQVKKFVMVSTDKAVNPTNVMGATKRVAEMYVSSMNAHKGSKTKFITTRFGNVLGSNGSVIPLFKKQIEAGGPLTLTHKEITRYFMTIPEACQLVLEAAAMGKGGEIFLFDMGTSVKIYDLAVRMIQLSGLRYPEDIDIEITGLRPGEKLYEELLNDEENTIPTHHKKITIAQVRNQNVEQTIALIEKLCVQNKIQDSESTVNRIKEIVPEYISENSVFSSLDALSKTQ